MFPGMETGPIVSTSTVWVWGGPRRPRELPPGLSASVTCESIGLEGMLGFSISDTYGIDNTPVYKTRIQC
jgi:hypothetical protein